MPQEDNLILAILEEAHNSRYSIHLGANKINKELR